MKAITPLRENRVCTHETNAHFPGHWEPTHTILSNGSDNKYNVCDVTRSRSIAFYLGLYSYVLAIYSYTILYLVVVPRLNKWLYHRDNAASTFKLVRRLLRSTGH